MNRKNFIRSMGIIGVSVSLSPWKLVGAESSIQRFRLPPASVHIPHGNFASNQAQYLFISELNLSISSQVFMKTGIEPSNHDLEVLTIQRNDEFLNVSLVGNTQVQSGQINGFKATLRNTHLSLDERNFTLTFDITERIVQVARKA